MIAFEAEKVNRNEDPQWNEKWKERFIGKNNGFLTMQKNNFAVEMREKNRVVLRR